MAIGVSIYKDLLKNKTYEELVEYLKEQESYLISDELKKAREEEIATGIDDNNCISNVETEITAIKELLQEKSFENYKKINNAELQEVLNLIELNPKFNDGIRLLSKEEVVNYKQEYNLSVDNIIPLIDLYDNEFVVYNITTNKFNILDISDEFLREIEDIKNYVEKLKVNEVNTTKGFLRKYKIDENGNSYEEEIELNFQPDPTKLYVLQIQQKLNLDPEEVFKNSKRLDDVKATYYWNSSRGGTSLIVADDGSYLGATSAVNFDKHLEEFKSGRRNGNFNEKNTMILKINCHSCNNELEIDCSKYPNNVKTLDTMCPNCKSMIKFGNLNYSENKEVNNASSLINFDEAKKKAEIEAAKYNKFIVEIKENDDYWLFEADNEEHPFDDGAGSVYVSKKDGSIKYRHLWEMDFNSKFLETAKTINELKESEYKDRITVKNNEVDFVSLEEIEQKINNKYTTFDNNDENSQSKELNQEELKSLYYQTMTEEEKTKLLELNMSDFINKISNPNYQIKYIENVGYVMIGEGYLILDDGTEPTHYFVKVFKTPDEFKKEIISQYNEKNKISEISAIETIGNPINKKENTILLVSSDYAVIDNQRYNLPAQNKIEIDNIIKNNIVEIKKIVEQQTTEFLATHTAINNTSKYFYIKLSDDSIKISYQTGTDSDNFIKKLIDEISEIVVSKINNSKGLREIIDNIFSKLTGNSKEDIDYLNKISEEYKLHPLSKEILREIGRKIYDLLPENEKTEMNNAYNKDVENIHKIIDEAGKYIFGKEKNLLKAKEILLDFLDKNKTLYNDDLETEYHNFNDVIEFTTYVKKYKPEKNVKWIDFPFITIYSYLAYIYNEETNCEEALKMIEKAIKWNPMSLSPLFEKCETYKFQKKWEEFKKNTELLYDKIYNASDLAHYYRNLGFYYIETNKLDLAYALYTASLKFEKTTNAFNEMMYINKQLNRNNYNMSAEEGLTLLKENNIPFGPKQENLDLLVSIYANEKELIKNPDVELLLASRIYYLTKDNRFAPFYEMLDKTTSCSILIPRSWKPLKDEAKNSFGPNNMFAIYTDSSALFQANYDGKCDPEYFDDAYRINVDNIKYSDKYKATLLKETALTLNLQQGPKEFKTALFEIADDNKTIRIYHHFTIINGIFVDFSINVSNEIDYTNDSKFNNQKNVIDLMNVLSSIIEINNNDNNIKDKSEFINNVCNKFSELKDNKLIDDLSKIIINFDNQDPYWITVSQHSLTYMILKIFSKTGVCKYNDIIDNLKSFDSFKKVIKDTNNNEADKILYYEEMLKATDNILKSCYDIICSSLNLKNDIKVNAENKITDNIIEHTINSQTYFNFKIKFPKKYGELIKTSEVNFKIGNYFTILFAKCSELSKLNERATQWLENSAKTNNQTIIKDWEKSYTLNNGLFSVVERAVEKDNKKRIYKFIYMNESMIIIAYNNTSYSEEVENNVKNAIISIKEIGTQQKIERDPFTKNDNVDKKVENYMNEFIDKNKDIEQQSNEDLEFQKYSELYKEKFGKNAYIAMPSGTKQQTINAIKECLKRNEDVLDELLYPNFKKDMEDGVLY